MTRPFKSLFACIILTGLSGCDPTGLVPSVSEQIAAANAAGITTGTTVQSLGLPGDASQCQRSAATLANPLSTPAQREGATMAAQANGCL